MEHTVQVYTLCRGLGRQVKPVPLPSVQEVKPYLAVLSTFSTAGIAEPLPACNLLVPRITCHELRGTPERFLKRT